jgi:hypothetical protein
VQLGLCFVRICVCIRVDMSSIMHGKDVTTREAVMRVWICCFHFTWNTVTRGIVTQVLGGGDPKEIRSLYEGVSRSFRTESITKYTLARINTR